MQVEKILLNLKAVSLDTKKGFSYTSGKTGPIYCDNRLILSYPLERNQIIEEFLKLIKEKNLDYDIVAGIATAGIPWASIIEDRLKKPLIYVRGKSKTHGKKNQIEGNLPEDSDVLVIEDLINTGGSSLAACKSIMEKGGNIVACLSIFNYGFTKAQELFADEKIKLYSLSSLDNLIKIALNMNYIDETGKTVLENWRNKSD